MQSKKVLLVHPGTQYSYHTVRQLKEFGLLYKFCTGLALSDAPLPRILKKIFKVLRKRSIPFLNRNELDLQPLKELLALALLKSGLDSEDVLYYRNKYFQRKINNQFFDNASVVIGYDTSSWILAERCRLAGTKFILDASIGHPLSKEIIFKKLSKRYPEWSKGFRPKKNKFIYAELEEIELADLVVVPSKFVFDTYVSNGVPEKKLRINHFGTNLEYFSPKKWDKPIEKLKFLFFGSLNGRKGLPLLFEAWDLVSSQMNAELILAGYEKIPSHIRIPKNVMVLGPVLKEDRLSLFHSADVFVFPSFFEGFAQVQIEAAACGLPLIGTYNSGGEEIIEQGRNGLLVDIEQPSALADAILFFNVNKEKIPDMGYQSHVISKNFDWKDYGSRWNQIISDLILDDNR